MSGKRYGNLEYRAKRYVTDVNLYGMGFSAAREHVKLPTILSRAINILFWGPEGKPGRPVLPINKWNRAIELALTEYRRYYRDRSNKQLAAG